MTFRELEAWRTKHNVPDTWWVSVDGTVQDETYALADALQIKSQTPTLHISVLNNIYASHANPTWVDLTLHTVNVTGVPAKSASTVATAAAPATAEKAAAAAPAAAAALPDDFLKKFETLVADFEAAKREIAALRKIADTYKDSFAEAKAILDEREEFLEMSEAQLFEKAQKQEVRNTELDQLAENLSKREASLKAAGG